MGYQRLCTKSPVRNLTRKSIRTFWPHYEGFFATKEVCFYAKKSYKGTTFGAKPSISGKCTCMLTEIMYRKSQSFTIYDRTCFRKLQRETYMLMIERRGEHYLVHFLQTDDRFSAFAFPSQRFPDIQSLTGFLL